MTETQYVDGNVQGGRTSGFVYVVLEKGLKINPKMSSASALLGVSLYEMGEYAGARNPLEMALRANPKDDNAELFLANFAKFCSANRNSGPP